MVKNMIRVRKTCKARGCNNKLPSDRLPWVVWCCDECGVAVALVEAEKVKAARARKERRELRERKEKAKPYQWHLERAQAACNAYIRALYAGQGCYTCGAREGQKQAGHCFTRGARPDLRFHIDNIRIQCVRCNDHLSGNVGVFKDRLRAELGEERFDALAIRGKSNWSQEELAEITLEFRAKTKALGRGECVG